MESKGKGTTLNAAEMISPAQDREGLRIVSPGRILVVAPQPFYENRGTPIALRRVVEAACRRGYEIDLLTYPVGESIELPGLRLFRVGTRLPLRRVPIGLSARKILLDLLLAPAILKLTARGRYSCIHVLEEAAFLAVCLRRWHKLPVLYDMQSSMPEQLMGIPFWNLSIAQKVLRSCERWLIRNADRIVCSAGLLDHVVNINPNANVREWFFPDDPIDVSAAEASEFRAELGILPESRVVLYTGNFKPYQGVSRLIDAIPQVLSQAPDVVFLIVGADVPSDHNLPEQAFTLQGQGSLRLIPRQPKSALYRFFSIADIIVSPRDNTGNIGLKVFDYMYSGKPILATDTPAHRAVLDDDRALLVSVSPEGIGSGILKLLHDPSRANRLGKTARAYAERNCSWKTFEEHLEVLYGWKNTRGTEKRREEPGMPPDRSSTPTRHAAKEAGVFEKE